MTALQVLQVLVHVSRSTLYRVYVSTLKGATDSGHQAEHGGTLALASILRNVFVRPPLVVKFFRVNLLLMLSFCGGMWGYSVV